VEQARWTRCALTRRRGRVDPYDPGFVDLAGSQGLVGQREGRIGSSVIDWLRERTQQFRDAIELAIDPAVYASAICTPRLLPARRSWSITCTSVSSATTR
jgi:hypothetical protein